MQIDVFNGDADGICALHQLRLSNPIESKLVTGVKRDINLLSRVEANASDSIVVLDISLDKNRQDLLRLLDVGATIIYYDHHFAGEIPQHELLTAVIDTQPSICTSLLVNKALKDQYLAWAVTAAFGDNLFESAIDSAKPLGLPTKKLEQLKQLGTCINYNGYGSSLDDLFYHPDALYNMIKPYRDPFDFIESNDAYNILLNGYQDDISKASAVPFESQSQKGTVFILPDEQWSRRVNGIYGNDLAQKNPDKAHAVLTSKGSSYYQVSVRAPLKTKMGADTLCRQFDTGGGRQAAAGINELPVSELDNFMKVFHEHF